MIVSLELFQIIQLDYVFTLAPQALIIIQIIQQGVVYFIALKNL